MGKKKLKIIFGSIAIIIVIAGYFGMKWAKENSQTDNSIGNEYTPEAEINEEQLRQTNINLYFPNKETKKLTVEGRQIDIKEIMNVPYEKIMNLLILGPQNTELEPIIPKGTKVLKTFLEDDTLVIDLTKDFLNYDMEQDNAKENLINSVVDTMTQLTEVNSVRFLIEGKENEQFKENYIKK